MARRIYTIVRWSLFAVAVLLVSGVSPFAGHTAEALVGTAGPIKLTVAPVTNLSDGSDVTIHAEAQPGTSIYSVTGHLCLPGEHTGDFFFGFLGPACTDKPVGQSDVEKITVLGGDSSADLTFKVGTGTTNWMNDRGYPYTITCDDTHPCDLVIRVEITNSTVYFRAPLCFGAACPPDLSGLPAPPVTTATTPAGAPAAAAAATANDAGSKGTGGGADHGATAGGSAATTTVPAGSDQSASRASTSSRSSSAPDGTALDTAQNAVAIPSGGMSQGLRVFIAALAGAIGGARIITVVGRARRSNPVGAR